MVPEPSGGSPMQRAVDAEQGSGLGPGDMESLVQEIPDVAIILLDTSGRILTWNAGAEAIKGWQAEEIIGYHFSVFYPTEAVAVGHPDRELELAALTGSYCEEGWRVRKDATRFWAKVQILALRDDDGDLTGFGKVTLDLSRAREKEEQLSNVLALLEKTIRLDHLTGLPNRRAWDEHLGEQLQTSQARHRPLCIGLLDLDRFKVYNDEHGHLAGDVLLKRAALRWRQQLRPGQMLARYGGEEFILSLPDCELDDAQKVLERLLSATARRSNLLSRTGQVEFLRDNRRFAQSYGPGSIHG